MMRYLIRSSLIFAAIFAVTLAAMTGKAYAPVEGQPGGGAGAGAGGGGTGSPAPPPATGGFIRDNLTAPNIIASPPAAESGARGAAPNFFNPDLPPAFPAPPVGVDPAVPAADDFGTAGKDAQEQKPEDKLEMLVSRGYYSDDPEKFRIGFAALIGWLLQTAQDEFDLKALRDRLNWVDESLDKGKTPAEIREAMGNLVSMLEYRLERQAQAAEEKRKEAVRREREARERSERLERESEARERWEREREGRTVTSGPKGSPY